MRRWGLLAAALVLTACSGGPTSSGPVPAPASTPPPSSAAPTPDRTPAPEPAPTPEPRRQPRAGVDPDDIDPRVARQAVRHLAGEIGPRPGHTRAYDRAATWVERRLTAAGWRVERQRFPTPGGVSWGVPVEAGPGSNVVATRGDVRPGRPWLLVGAHLDTVPQSPGAEDNASGIGALLAVADAVGQRRTRLPVVLVAFGSEEPRGPGDDDHHYGSRAYVASLTAARRGTLRGALSLDRVGVGDAVVVGSAAEPSPLRAELARAARRAAVPTVLETGQRSSDHWSFVREGLPGVRLGSTPYAGYHSPGDTPDVVDLAQVERAARLVVAWLR